MNRYTDPDPDPGHVPDIVLFMLYGVALIFFLFGLWIGIG